MPKKTLLVLGGSLGARRVNQLRKELKSIQNQNVQVIWQCGKLYFEGIKKYNSTTVQVVAFERMDFVYASADIIISEGASSVSELSIVGKPVILFLL
jgi:UDP-N-acetylglucosamine--N-acetylmuramyl-(pentapeptide) pyrophosphoryl-undecaprenol N-acetylglucosamine transferase